MNIRCLIIDDEPLSREIIETYVHRIDFLELIDSCEDVFDALDHVENGKIDLILSDIQMPGVNGVEFIKSLANPPHIIFITAYDFFAVEGYDMGVVDYLLKPVPFDRFFKAVSKVRQLQALRGSVKGIFSQNNSDHLFIKVEGKFIKILFDELLYIESLRDYQKIHLRSGKHLLVYATLKSMEQRLPQPLFFRIHHSYLINIQQIKSLQGNRVHNIFKRLF